MEQALWLDAAASAAIEEVCDTAQRQIAEQLGQSLTHRFSCGYGDLPLSIQPQLCTLLDSAKSIGLSVSHSSMLTPVKSVTAILGILPAGTVASAPKPLHHLSFKRKLCFKKKGCFLWKIRLIDSLRRADRFWLLDGAMGTQLQKKLVAAGRSILGLIPELCCITEPELVTQVHREYLEAGADILYTNTFGANRKKLTGSGYTPQQIIPAAVGCAKQAATGKDTLVALDIGPIGELMEPTGTLSFQQAYDLFAEQVNAGVQAGVDLIVIETMTDLYEVKAAILAAKECCEQLGKALPVLVSMTFEANGRTFTGCCVPSMAAVIEGLGADAIGFNCSLGPVELLPFARQLRENTSLPLFIKPNAGLPDPLTGSYSIDAAKFADCMQEYLALGIHLFGGCCGTDPSFIRAMRQMLDQKCPQDFPTPVVSRQACVCTPTCFVPIDRVRIIGERINPTGKKRLKQAILEQDFDYILSQGLSQLEAGAQILDVNMGMPEVDESRMLPLVIQKLQGVLVLRCKSTPPMSKPSSRRCVSTTENPSSTRSTGRKAR